MVNNIVPCEIKTVEVKFPHSMWLLQFSNALVTPHGEALTQHTRGAKMESFIHKLITYSVGYDIIHLFLWAPNTFVSHQGV